MTLSARRVKPGQPRGAGDPGTILMVVGLVAVVTIAIAVDVAVNLTSNPGTVNPFRVLEALTSGTVAWTTATTVVLILEGAVMLSVVFGVAVAWGNRHTRRPAVDSAAKLMGTGPDIHRYTLAGSREHARKLGIQDKYSAGPVIGKAVATGQTIVLPWGPPFMGVWPPEAGKTSTQAVPAILSAPGPVMTTTNKVDDLITATIEHRSQPDDDGPRRVWVFDLQQIYSADTPTFYWDPLSYVKDDQTAEKLAAVFGAQSGRGHDPFWHNAAQRLLKLLLLAGALGNRPVTDVLAWLSDYRAGEQAALILETHGRGHQADELRSQMNGPEKQRGGVYEHAMNWMGCVGIDTVRPWVTAGPGKRHFDVTAFVTSHDTLYCLSQDSGAASAAQIVAALVQAVAEAAETRARRSPGGRLPLPLLMELDETANVVKWPRLPDVYTYYRGLGIVPRTYFQSWKQGCAAFGEDGMQTMFDSAVFTFGGGKDTDLMERLVKLVGRFSYRAGSRSTGASRADSYSVSEQREMILDVADLTSLPLGRILMCAPRTVPILVETRPFTDPIHTGKTRKRL